MKTYIVEKKVAMNHESQSTLITFVPKFQYVTPSKSFMKEGCDIFLRYDRTLNWFQI